MKCAHCGCPLAVQFPRNGNVFCDSLCATLHDNTETTIIPKHQSKDSFLELDPKWHKVHWSSKEGCEQGGGT